MFVDIVGLTQHKIDTKIRHFSQPPHLLLCKVTKGKTAFKSRLTIPISYDKLMIKNTLERSDWE